MTEVTHEHRVLLLGDSPEPGLDYIHMAVTGAKTKGFDVAVESLWLTRDHVGASHNLGVEAQIPNTSDYTDLTIIESGRLIKESPHLADPQSEYGIRGDMAGQTLIKLQASVGAVVLRGDPHGLAFTNDFLSQLYDFDQTYTNGGQPAV